MPGLTTNYYDPSSPGLSLQTHNESHQNLFISVYFFLFLHIRWNTHIRPYILNYFEHVRNIPKDQAHQPPVLVEG